MKKNFNKKKLLTFGVVSLFALALVTAGLLTYYGQIQQKVNVEQAVVLSGIGCVNNVCDEEVGSIEYSPTTLYSQVYTVMNNDPENSREVSLVTSSSPGTALGEIVTSYYEIETYDKIITIRGYSIPAVVTVKDLGDSVEWTIDMDETVSAFANGHAQYGLIISTDKVHPAFQVHSNDGTCLVDKGGWVAGTHLYSEYYDNSWHTGGADCESTNTPVINKGITAIGEYSTNDNTGAVFTITIPKTLLGDEEFYWAMQLMGNTVDTQYPTEWVKWSGDASTFATINLKSLGAELSNPLTLQSLESLNFVVVNDFDTTGFTGTIITSINPSP